MTALPSPTVKALFGQLSRKLTGNEINILGGIYQRSCLVVTEEEALEILRVSMDWELTDEDKTKLALAHKIAKPEILGQAVETLTEITQSPLSAQKDKVLATQALHDLYGDKERIGDSGLTDKIILNLVGK